MASTCYVYVLQVESGYVKIGVSVRPDERLAELQVGNHEQITIAHAVTCQDKRAAVDLEAALHRALSVHRVRGEWFKCAAQDVTRHVETARAEVAEQEARQARRLSAKNATAPARRFRRNRCLNCGASLKGMHHAARYCGAACRQAGYRQRHAPVPGGATARECAYCGKSFLIVGKSSRKYCKPSCRTMACRARAVA